MLGLLKAAASTVVLSSAPSHRTYHLSQRDQLAKSTKTRAEGNAEILQAGKEHKLMPAGEAI
jgi:hypothetical protein